MAQQAVLQGTEQHVLHSDVVGGDFEITVYAPAAELGVGPTPVVYGTDANLGLGMYVDTINLLMAGGEIPPVTLVGIGYPIGADLIQFGHLRSRDFTPHVDEWSVARITELNMGLVPEAGGGPKFHEFLTTELRSFVNDHYEVTDNATYIGDSLGGLFGTWVLLHHPESFDRYILGSPWLAWDAKAAFEWEAAYAAANDDLEATVFYACGASEDVLSPLMQPPSVPMFARGNVAAYTERMAGLLASRGYPSLELTQRIYPEQTHFTVPSIIYAQGLREVFTAERLGR